jgi:hypothetical protein
MFKLGIDLSAPAFDHLLHLQSMAPAGCSDADVNRVLGAFNLAELRRLDSAFRRGQVVRRVFHAGGGSGCLLYHLNNAIVSFGAQSAYFAKDTDVFRASQQLVAAWDSETLSEAKVRELLAEAIRARSGRVRDPWRACLSEGAAEAPGRNVRPSPNRYDCRRARDDNRLEVTAENEFAVTA